MCIVYMLFIEFSILIVQSYKSLNSSAEMINKKKGKSHEKLPPYLCCNQNASWCFHVSLRSPQINDAEVKCVKSLLSQQNKVLQNFMLSNLCVMSKRENYLCSYWLPHYQFNNVMRLVTNMTDMTYLVST